MDFPRLLHAFLLRDVTSYFLPGVFSLAPLLIWNPYPVLLTRVQPAIQTFGAFPVGVGALVITYVVGYLVGTAAYFAWERLAQRRGACPYVDNEELGRFLKADYGSIVAKRDSESARDYSDRVVGYCYNHVRVNDLEAFVMIIERMDSMKNFEVGLSLALLVWAIVPLSAGCNLSAGILAALAVVLAVRLFFFTSVDADKLLDNETVSTYLRLHSRPAGAGTSAAQTTS